MADIIYRLSWDAVAGSYGYTIEYRDLSGDVWVVPSTSPNPTLNVYYDLVLQTGVSYAIRVSSIGTNCTTSYTLTLLDTPSGACCPATYTLSPDESYCFKEDTQAPTIIQSDICLAPSQRVEYSGLGTKLFTSGYNSDLSSANFTLLSTTTQWKSTLSTNGPMNREGVWVDTDCNGTKDPLTAGQLLQFSATITTSVAKTVYVGIGGDNQFRVQLNGTTIVERNNPADNNNFYYWYVFPVLIPSGTSYFMFRGVGDGSVNDALACAVYNNTHSQISSASSDASLNILFKSSDLIGEHIDIANSCASGYFLDTSAGEGAYVCRRKLSTATIACTTTTTTTTTTLP